MLNIPFDIPIWKYSHILNISVSPSTFEFERKRREKKIQPKSCYKGLPKYVGLRVYDSSGIVLT